MSSPSSFAPRHIGPSPADQRRMLKTLGHETLEDFIDQIVPDNIRSRDELDLPDPLSEQEALQRLREVMGRNRVLRSFIGLGYHDCITPPVIQRNLFENPGWYTAYTPYQPEISQGRLEACLNFQTLISDLTGLPVSNASLLDEGTACAEALSMALGQKPKATSVFISDQCHPHVIGVVLTRMAPLGIEVHVGSADQWSPQSLKEGGAAAVLVSYPDTLGALHDPTSVVEAAHESGALAIATADPLALTLIKPPGELGFDICVGNCQRLGVPLGFGGPHAAYIAVTDALKRRLPGRLVGISRDAHGNPAYRLSLQTREQHIRREKATSNICTAQVLLAVMASMYAVYHGPEGLRAIARRIHSATNWLASELQSAGLELVSEDYFDTLTIACDDETEVIERALATGINLRSPLPGMVTVALDEKVSASELLDLLSAFGVEKPTSDPRINDLAPLQCSPQFHRVSPILEHPVFHRHHSETEMMRYLRRLQEKDIALDRSMIPLGSCTMKLNAAAEMMPLSWPEVSGLHPFAPLDQAMGYGQLIEDLEVWLAECTGFAAVSLQPNAGSQGEFAGLITIRRYHESRGDTDRDVCLIPTSAHGTNPASAVMAGFKVVPVLCDEDGNIDLPDLREKLTQHGDKVGALMVTYPSTHGVFEESITEICQLTHDHGGQVYMDGANLNAQLGLTSPGRIGADVCHLNLHKTFCIPHGGGGPGVGPIAVAEQLTPFLPGHLSWQEGQQEGAVCSAPWGSASIDTITWMYLAMMGPQLVESTEVAILNANYVAHQLRDCFPTLYTGRGNLVAHECILDFRHFEKVTVEDVAKRLMDFGFHAPTMSWPVAGTLMIEPTESESLAELDRFCEAMRAIHAEIEAVESGNLHAEDNPLKNAPHIAGIVTADEWDHPYSRQTAAYPLEWVRDAKYWPPVGRIDNVHGDRNLICTCISVEAAATASA